VEQPGRPQAIHRGARPADSHTGRLPETARHAAHAALPRDDRVGADATLRGPRGNAPLTRA